MDSKYDLTGKKFNKLTVVEFSHQDENRNYHWLCKCDCGNTKIVRTKTLKAGWTKSCGCLRGDVRRSRPNLIWENKGKLTKTFFYRTVNEAKKRNLECSLTLEEAQHIFDEQLGRCALSGVEIDFGKGCSDANRTASLDRIDSSKGYTKDNVQWLHKKVNTMKWDLTQDSFLEFVKKIYLNSNQI